MLWRIAPGCGLQIDTNMYARLERATNALAEYAMRAVEEYDA
jgi:hypothetical protein